MASEGEGPARPPTSPAPRPQDTTEATAFTELLQIVVGVPLAKVLSRVAELARDVVPGVDEASITLLRPASAHTVGFTGDLSVWLDERQYEDGFGPCVDAAASGHLVVVPDTADGGRYPGFARQAARAGVASCWSVGFPMPQDSTGALNLYVRGVTGPPSPDAVVLARRFAEYSSVAIANATLYSEVVDRVGHLETAMASRATIKQAKGMLMAARGCDAEQAFRLLAQASQRRNLKLREVAQQVVQQRGALP